MMPRYLKYGWKTIQEEDSVIPLRPFCASAQVKIEFDIACEKAAGAQIAKLDISKLIYTSTVNQHVTSKSTSTSTRRETSYQHLSTSKSVLNELPNHFCAPVSTVLPRVDGLGGRPRLSRFPKSWGYPNSWRFYNGKFYGKFYENGWFRGKPILGNLHIILGKALKNPAGGGLCREKPDR